MVEGLKKNRLVYRETMALMFLISGTLKKSRFYSYFFKKYHFDPINLYNIYLI